MSLWQSNQITMADDQVLSNPPSQVNMKINNWNFINPPGEIQLTQKPTVTRLLKCM